jgi:hypothetical protein
MGGSGILLIPWGLSCGNHQVLEILNLADKLGEIRVGHFHRNLAFRKEIILGRRLCVKGIPIE